MGGLGDMGGWMGIGSRRVDLSEVNTQNLTAYTKRQIREAIRGGQEISIGGGGTVYSAHIDLEQVAIKKVGTDDTARSQMKTEISTLQFTGNDQENIIKLQGYCEKPASLVYDYMTAGSLYSRLHEAGDHPVLSWQTRLSIARDVAEALSHLQGLNPPIVHRDIKSANVLLDNNLRAKLADFGLAMKIQDPENPPPTFNFGTGGYIPMDGSITLHYDTFSFGVMLMELITGRKAFDDSRESLERNLGEWTSKIVSNIPRDNFHQMYVDANMDAAPNMASLNVAVQLAVDCTNGNRYARPNPTTIIEQLITASSFASP